MRLERAAADRFEPPRDVLMTRSRWDAALEDYYAEHETLATDGDARGPAYFWMGAEEIGEPAGAEEGTTARLRQVRQTLADPADHRDWVIEAVVDLDATGRCRRAGAGGDSCRSLPARPSTSPFTRSSHSPNGPDQTTRWSQFRRSVNREVGKSLACSGRDIPRDRHHRPDRWCARASPYPPGARCSPRVAPTRPLRRLPSPDRRRRKASRAEKRAEKRATKAGEKAASQVSGKVGTADSLAAARAAAAAGHRRHQQALPASKRAREGGRQGRRPARSTPPGEEPSFWYDLSEWSLRRKVALVLAGARDPGRRLRRPPGATPRWPGRQLRRQAASQVTVLGPAVDYLAAAEHAAVVARADGIDDPKLDAAQQEVVDAGDRSSSRRATRPT